MQATNQIRKKVKFSIKVQSVVNVLLTTIIRFFKAFILLFNNDLFVFF